MGVSAFIMGCIGFGVAMMFCEVYELVIDTMLMCFCEAKMNNSGCIPSQLESLMDENYHKAKEQAVAEGMERAAAAAEAEEAESEPVKQDALPTSAPPASDGNLSAALLNEMRSKFERCQP